MDRKRSSHDKPVDHDLGALVGRIHALPHSHSNRIAERGIEIVAEVDGRIGHVNDRRRVRPVEPGGIDDDESRRPGIGIREAEVRSEIGHRNVMKGRVGGQHRRIRRCDVYGHGISDILQRARRIPRQNGERRWGVVDAGRRRRGPGEAQDRSRDGEPDG